MSVFQVPKDATALAPLFLDVAWMTRRIRPTSWSIKTNKYPVMSHAYIVIFQMIDSKTGAWKIGSTNRSKSVFPWFSGGLMTIFFSGKHPLPPGAWSPDSRQSHAAVVLLSSPRRPVMLGWVQTIWLSMLPQKFTKLVQWMLLEKGTQPVYLFCKLEWLHKLDL